MEGNTYIIRGGVAGRERLRILAQVMLPGTLRLFERLSIGVGMACLDVGCGGGDVAFELARLTGGEGRVVGTEIDDVKLRLARAEAEQRQLRNIDFRHSDIVETGGAQEFDIAYTRFLLTHLNDPARALAHMRQYVRPGGILVAEDIDFTGHFCYPDSPAFRRYVELYTQAVQGRGGDPNIGPRLPGLMLASGLERVGIQVVQPAGIEGEVKLIAAITMENIAEAVHDQELAAPEETTRIIEELYALAHKPGVVVSLPRIVQTWGYCPGR